MDAETIAARIRADLLSPEVPAWIDELTQLKAWQLAAACARAAVDAGQRRGPIYLAMARGLFQGGKSDRAGAILNALTGVEMLSSEANILHVQVLLELGKPLQARAVGERWLLHDPSDVVMRRLLFRVRKDPEPHDHPDALVSVARAEELARAGFTPRAVRVLRQVLLRRPEDARAQQLLRSLTGGVSLDAAEPAAPQPRTRLISRVAE